MKNYSEMTGFEINKAVAELEGLDCNVRQFFNEDGLKLSAVRTTSGYKNYLVNWSDAGHILFRESIGIKKDIEICCDVCGEYYETDFWEASHCLENYHYTDKNPLRAAMIVFLMMKGN